MAECHVKISTRRMPSGNLEVFLERNILGDKLAREVFELPNDESSRALEKHLERVAHSG